MWPLSRRLKLEHLLPFAGIISSPGCSSGSGPEGGTCHFLEWPVTRVERMN